jgi:hypothetical protein
MRLCHHRLKIEAANESLVMHIGLAVIDTAKVVIRRVSRNNGKYNPNVVLCGSTST